jgi:metal-sulfur cluster biosynthetic enzyme
MSTQPERHNPLEAAAYNALRHVIDPEIGENIVDLGLVYGITAAEEVVEIRLTMTSMACPMGEMIIDDVMEALSSALPKGVEASIRLVWEPLWTPEMISAEARDRLGWK